MKKYIQITILAICFPLCMIAQSEKNFIDQNYIEITGTAEMLIVPDEIYIAVILTEKNHKKTIEEQEQLLITNLKSLGIDTNKDLQVSNLGGMYTKYFLKKNEVEKIKKYQLIVHSSEMLGKAFVVLDRLNITNATIEKVNHSEIEKFTRETKLNSLKAAKEKATQYAEVIDQEIGKALFIKEQELAPYNTSNNIVIRGQSPYPNFRQKPKLPEIADLTFKEIRITASVLTRFELKIKKQ